MDFDLYSVSEDDVEPCPDEAFTVVSDVGARLPLHDDNNSNNHRTT